MAGFQMDHYHQHTYVPGQPIEKANTWWVWKGFWILLAVTTVEVGFAFANGWGQLEGGRNFLPAVGEKWLMIALTLVKAYFIVFSFMHLGHEKLNFKITLGGTTIFILYFIALMMWEGYALRDNQMIRPDFFQRRFPSEQHHDEAAHGTDAGHHHSPEETGGEH